MTKNDTCLTLKFPCLVVDVMVVVAVIHLTVITSLVMWMGGVMLLLRWRWGGVVGREKIDLRVAALMIFRSRNVGG